MHRIGIVTSLRHRGKGVVVQQGASTTSGLWQNVLGKNVFRFKYSVDVSWFFPVFEGSTGPLKFARRLAAASIAIAQVQQQRSTEVLYHIR